MHMLVVPRSVTIRFAAVQVRFVGGARRDYLIVHRAAKGNKDARVEGGWTATSIRFEAKGKGRARELDLRNAEHVAEMEKALQSMPLDDVE